MNRPCCWKVRKFTSGVVNAALVAVPPAAQQAWSQGFYASLAGGKGAATNDIPIAAVQQQTTLPTP